MHAWQSSDTAIDVDLIDSMTEAVVVLVGVTCVVLVALELTAGGASPGVFVVLAFV